MITAERLKECFVYNPDDGLFTSRIRRKHVAVGDVLGIKANTFKQYS